ncbi:energy transducer TonB [Microbulbifer thermotolerans]|uniref:energy transducer TonB family protein n=1 Tax=Microbulbifer TaxID=48073 RepID=UPI00224AF60F|nr:energy transducer TonB [Microbulbifer thermotolerans]MCX2783203.1 energy transducer TonB [Microbulbifer thermotolerans]
MRFKMLTPRKIIALSIGTLVAIMSTASCVLAGEDVIGSPRIQLVLPDNIPDCTAGSVLVGFDVGDDGKVLNARVLESTPAEIFDQAAIATVQRFQLDRAAGKTGLKYKVVYPPMGNCEGHP